MNVDDLQKDVQLVLDLMRPLIETASDLTWRESDGFLPVIYRSILVRQFESLDAVSHLVAEKKGYAAPPLLRPACEELIWIKYLSSISNADAERLLLCAGSIEQFRLLKAQDGYAGRTVMKELGLQPFFEAVTTHQDVAREQWSDLGEKLNWDRHSRQSGQLPSLRWLARATHQTETYNFIYHATSRFVHFSGQQLLRHAWGKPGKVSIRSIHFRDYWGSLALYWGLKLFLDSTIELLKILDMPEKGLDEAKVYAAAQRIGEHGQVPIITAEDLVWPE